MATSPAVSSCIPRSMGETARKSTSSPSDVRTTLKRFSAQERDRRECRAADIRNIEILCDQEALSGLRRGPDVRVGSTGQLLSANGINIVSKSSEDRD